MTRESNFVPLLFQIIDKAANWAKQLKEQYQGWNEQERTKNARVTVVGAESETATDNYRFIEIKKKTITV